MFTSHLKFGEQVANTSGVVTLLEWSLFPDGDTYKHIYADRWEIVTEKDFPVPGLHMGSERWFAVAVSKELKPLVIIPGCQVKSWAACNKKPQAQSCWEAV